MQSIKPYLVLGVLVAGAAFVGCSGVRSPERAGGIVGRWRVVCDSSQRPFCPKRSRQEFIRFHRNGTYSFGYVRVAGRWRLSGDELRMHEKMSGIRERFTTRFSKDRHKLVLERGRKKMILMRATR
ncbi:MAG: hypothetical protein KC609_07475 [Myxococcales bacterium]|nr:hypothetical protein [Myxococcales bacterium]